MDYWPGACIIICVPGLDDLWYFLAHLLGQRQCADGKDDASVHVSLQYTLLAVNNDSRVAYPIMNIDDVMMAVAIDGESATMV